MANYNIKVEDVLGRFYDIQPDAEIRGLYEVRKLNDSLGDMLWYYFSSNNATFHSSGNDCVIRDINQSNSAYIGRLKQAFERAKNRNIKVFWLVLVFGDGIGLPPNGYDWIASIELRVSLDLITASLRMTSYPVGKGRKGYIDPCYIRIDQDKYFNSTFISCKDEEGNYTDKYMSDYFKIYDNRPYHDIIVVENDENEEEQIDEADNNDISRVEGGNNVLFYGVPGSGKSFVIDKECKDLDRMERVVFHPDYTYSDFVGQILPRLNDDGKLEYVFTPGPFIKLMDKAVKDPEHKYYLIVEEINRGNAPAIFGDIFQLLDRIDEDDKKVDKSLKVGGSKYFITNYDIAKEIYKDVEHRIMIPSNMYLRATMNTSDQNVFTLDTAFQRRWIMKQIKNNIMGAGHAAIKIEGSNITWGAFATYVNELVLNSSSEMASSEDKRLGAYFVKSRELSVDVFPEKVLKYLWDDAFKLDKEVIFDDKYKSLEQLVIDFETTSNGDRLKQVLRADVYAKMLERVKITKIEQYADQEGQS